MRSIWSAPPSARSPRKHDHDRCSHMGPSTLASAPGVPAQIAPTLDEDADVIAHDAPRFRFELLYHHADTPRKTSPTMSSLRSSAS